MRKVLKNAMAITLAAAMVVTAAPDLGNSADAAKKLAAAKKTYTVEVKKSVTVKVKNAGKKKTVKWSTNKAGKKVVKIAKAKTKANKKGVASVKVTGKTAGKSAKITAKVGKKSCKFTVKVTAAKADTATQAPSNAAASPSSAASQAPATSPSAAPTKQGGNNATEAPNPTATPTPRITATPRPTNTPSPIPKADAVSARKLGSEDKITVDGKEDGAEWENAGATFNLLANKYSVRGETKVKEATAQFMWEDNAFYALVKTDVKVDKVTVFVDADNDTKNANAVKAEATIGSEGKVAEVKVDCGALDAEKGANIEVQINEGSSTINLFDSVTDVVYDKDKDEWNVVPNAIKAGTDDSVLGHADLLGSMEQPTNAFFTDKGADIIAAAKIPNEWENAPAEGETEPALKTKTMTFVDPSFWTDVYTANGSESTYFTKVNTDVYINNPDRITLAQQNEEGNWYSDRSNAQAYIIWDKEYLYVLYDVNDPDVTDGNDDHYTCDSTEFFLDEDYSQPEAYVTDGSSDEVQLRVDAKTNVFSANDAGTGNYALVAHATKLKGTEDAPTGYQVEYIIKLNNQHQNGQIMGMELQINDCYTEETTNEETGEVTKAPSRACSLSAYDVTNNCYQYPNYFGRIKLINKAEAEVEPTEAPVKTAEPGQATEAPEMPEHVATKFADGTAITIDGKLDENAWNSIPSYEILKGEDVYADVKLAWDAEKLYVGAVVNDNDFDSASSDTWQRDGVEVFFDEDNSKDAKETNKDAFQYRYSGFNDEAKTYQQITEFKGSEVDAKYVGIKSANTITENNYVVEISIPWADAASIKAGKIVGFDFNVFDCSGGKRDAERLLITEGGLYNNPDKFGELGLVEADNGVSIDLSKTWSQFSDVKNNDDGSVTLKMSKGSADWQAGEFGFVLPEDKWSDNYGKIIIEYKNTVEKKIGYVCHYGNKNAAWVDGEKGNDNAVQLKAGEDVSTIEIVPVDLKDGLSTIRFYGLGLDNSITIVSVKFVK